MKTYLKQSHISVYNWVLRGYQRFKPLLFNKSLSVIVLLNLLSKFIIFKEHMLKLYLFTSPYQPLLSWFYRLQLVLLYLFYLSIFLLLFWIWQAWYQILLSSIIWTLEVSQNSCFPYFANVCDIFLLHS